MSSTVTAMHLSESLKQTLQVYGASS